MICIEIECEYGFYTMNNMKFNVFFDYNNIIFKLIFEERTHYLRTKYFNNKVQF